MHNSEIVKILIINCKFSVKICVLREKYISIRFFMASKHCLTLPVLNIVLLPQDSLSPTPPRRGCVELGHDRGIYPGSWREFKIKHLHHDGVTSPNWIRQYRTRVIWCHSPSILLTLDSKISFQL